MNKKTYLLILLSVFAIISCAPTNASRYREGSNVDQPTNLTVQDEQRLTKEALPKMLKDYPAAKNQELQKYISALGMKIVNANKLEGNPYHYTFTVVDVVDVNAFAMPAGTIFVTAPLIALASNEAELAGVVSHEIGHVVARHAAERMYAMEKAQNKTWIYAAGGAAVGAIVGYGLGRALCSEGDTACHAQAALLGGAVGAGGGLLAQKYTFLVNSREDEMEADRIGFKYAVAAGYDKDQVGKFYEKLLEIEKNANKSGGAVVKSLSDAMSTHPPSEERVKQMNELAAQSPARKSITNTPEFNKVKQIAAAVAQKIILKFIVLTTLLTIFISSFVIALSGAMMPGPLLTVTISESSRRGFIAGPLLIAGHAILELALVSALLLGLAPFFQMPVVFVVTALTGALILLWMAFNMFRSLPSLHLSWEEDKIKRNHPIASGIHDERGKSILDYLVGNNRSWLYSIFMAIRIDGDYFFLCRTHSG